MTNYVILMILFLQCIIMLEIHIMVLYDVRFSGKVFLKAVLSSVGYGLQS